MKKAAHPHVNQANAYARSVVAGKIAACKWVKLACRRHLNDLKRSKERAFPYRFDVGKAERSCQFAELFKHTKGHWAIPNPRDPEANRIRLSDWQCFARCCIRGWREKATGFRRFRVVYIEVPRKNGKSTTAATEGLESFAADGEFGAEVYSGATTEKQAWEVFRPARLMAKESQDFQDAYGVEVRGSSLLIEGNGSRFEPVIGKPGDGASPSMAIVDEYHEHPDSVLYDTMNTGMGARQQPLMFVITTAGTDIGGACYGLRDQVLKMLEGTQPDERLFGLVYTVDEGDDWTSEASLRKANPNYGISALPDFLLGEQKKAIENSRLQSVFKTKHLNIWVTARDAWMNMEWWNRQADPSLKPEQFKGCPCYFGVDLSSKLDLVGVVRVFRKEVVTIPHFFVFGKYYVPRRTVDDPKNGHYQGWAASGHLVATEGAGGANLERIDIRRILDDLKADARAEGVDQVGYDEWSAVLMEAELGAEGMTLVAVPQTTKALSDPMKEVEALTKAGQLHHDGNPVLSWMISNVTVREDPNENIFPRKERPENKIDGAVALINAMSRAVVAAPSGNVYDREDLLVV